MIEKFLEKFLPQITERVNENAEVGKALIEALAVLDNYATLNNVELTEEQINKMLGIVPEPTPEPNADIPAEIVQIVENKKRGRKPKTAWSWRFKTEEEFENEYGENWFENIGGTGVNWGTDMDEYNMSFLEGQPIKESADSRKMLEIMFKGNGNEMLINVKKYFGIQNPSLSGAKDFLIVKQMLTDEPLPQVAKTWNWRFKTEEELQQEFGLNLWKTVTAWNMNGDMDYLLGKPIIESDLSKQFIENLLQSKAVSIDTNKNLGIDSGSSNTWAIKEQLVTNKPLPTAVTSTSPTTSAWNWRFKTEEEFKEEYGDDWREAVEWSIHGGMDYLIGEPIAESSESRDLIAYLKKGKNDKLINTFRELGISSGDDDDWILAYNMLTNKPLPKVILTRGKSLTAPTHTAWTWRFKTEKEMQSDFGAEWREEWGIEERDFLFGKAIPETTATTDFIMNNVVNSKSGEMVNTKELFGIDSGNANENEQYLDYMMITNKPLSTIAAPAKRGRKPKAYSNWNWRFKTEEEFKEEYGDDWVVSMPSNINWGTLGSKSMSFLLGQPILQTPVAERIIKDLVNGLQNFRTVNVREYFGIKNPNIYADEEFNIPLDFLTQKPIPTTTAPKKRGRKPKSELPEIDLGGLEDIGDIDIDDIDFDNLVI
jgi:hypothetical protein